MKSDGAYEKADVAIDGNHWKMTIILKVLRLRIIGTQGFITCCYISVQNVASEKASSVTKGFASTSLLFKRENDNTHTHTRKKEEQHWFGFRYNLSLLRLLYCQGLSLYMDVQTRNSISFLLFCLARCCYFWSYYLVCMCMW